MAGINISPGTGTGYEVGTMVEYPENSGARWMGRAIENLVAHCDAVLSAHGVRSRRDSLLWWNHHTLDIPYPNAITLDGSTDVSVMATRTAELLAAHPGGHLFSVNDSFSSFDAGDIGMRRLISTPWHIRPPAPLQVHEARGPGPEVVRVKDADGLAEFDAALAAGFGSPDARRHHHDGLLHDSRYSFVAVREGGRLVSCGVGFDDGRCLGVYSLATLPGARRKGHAHAIVRELLTAATGAPAVTNPSPMSQPLFERFGFREEGRRTIWAQE